MLSDLLLRPQNEMGSETKNPYKPLHAVFLARNVHTPVNSAK